MIEELISKVFCTRNCAHLAHWKSDSYAEHTALGEFYDSVIDIIDNFVEVYQGNYTKIKTVKLLYRSRSFLKFNHYLYSSQ